MLARTESAAGQRTRSTHTHERAHPVSRPIHSSRLFALKNGTLLNRDRGPLSLRGAPAPLRGPRARTAQGGEGVEHRYARRRLRLLSYNIQAGIASHGYHHYLTHSWKHVLPYPERLENLDRIARLAAGYDLVGLQEVDGGSLRSGFVNQTEYLALQAGFPYWYDQTNRRLGRLTQHSLGILSKLTPTAVRSIRLPARIPGRGALVLHFGRGAQALLVMVLHLALGRRARFQQLACIAEILADFRHAVVMGDFNCRSDSPEMDWLLERTSLREPVHGLNTFPSWRPQRNIDHILVTPSLEVADVRVLRHAYSDHLPLAMEVVLPDALKLTAAPRPVRPDYGWAAGL